MKKKEIVETRVGSFVDFTGATRKYVIAALSEILPEVLVDEDGDEAEVEHIVIATNPDGGYVEDVLDQVVKSVSIGFAICNAGDTFNEKLGIEIAIGKARKRPTGVLYATDNGMINTKLVNALIEQEMAYFEANPGHAIVGYNKSKAKYESENQ